MEVPPLPTPEQGTDSAQSLEQLIGKLTEKQVSIDGILAQALLASAEPKFMRKYLKSSSSHMMDGKYSGLKII